MLLPWPTRTQRREAVASAEREKYRSRASAERAAAISRDIARMAEANHFADIIAAQIMHQRHRGPG